MLFVDSSEGAALDIRRVQTWVEIVEAELERVVREGVDVSFEIAVQSVSLLLEHMRGPSPAAMLALFLGYARRVVAAWDSQDPEAAAARDVVLEAVGLRMSTLAFAPSTRAFAPTIVRLESDGLSARERELAAELLEACIRDERPHLIPGPRDAYVPRVLRAPPVDPAHVRDELEVWIRGAAAMLAGEVTPDEATAAVETLEGLLGPVAPHVDLALALTLARATVATGRPELAEAAIVRELGLLGARGGGGGGGGGDELGAPSAEAALEFEQLRTGEGEG